MAIVAALRGLVEDVPTCECCHSDDGYVEAVCDAVKAFAGHLSAEQRISLLGACKWKRDRHQDELRQALGIV